MVSDNKEELKNEIELEVDGERLDEDAQIKNKFDAVMKAKAKEFAMAKIEAEKKAREVVLGEKEKTLSEKLEAAERIKEARKAKEEAEAAAAERVKNAEAVKDAAIKAASEKQKRMKVERIAAEKAEQRAALEKQRRQEAEKKAADMRLRALAAKKAADRLRDENLAKQAEHTMDAAAKAAAERVQAAEEEKALARKTEIAELERLIHKLEVEKNLVPEEPLEEPSKEVLVEAEIAEEPDAPAFEGNASEAAFKYAKYLREHNLKPGDATFVNPQDIGILFEEEDIEEPIEFSEDDLQYAIKKAEQRQKKIRDELEKKKWDKLDEDRKIAAQAKWERENGVKEDGFKEKLQSALAAPIYLHDSIQDAFDSFWERMYKDFVGAVYKTVRGYRLSQKAIGLNLLLICLMCGLIVTLLSRNTVYEYAYNGKVLGYVENQDDVTNVLSIAGEKLNSLNNESTENIEFSAGDNITFSVVDSNGKDVDDADDTINKLAYMTDIEVEAYGIYEDDKLITIVKSTAAAENLLEEVKAVLGTPDEGMEIVSVDFNKPLAIKPINVLLTSVQSNTAAKKQMTKGGSVEFYHLVEADETMDSIVEDFGTSALNVYDEDNRNVVTSLDVGDKICIRKEIEPVSVKLVETGKMKEIVPYETVEKETKDYYKGDEVVDVEGVDGIQIFEGTVTKVSGKVTNRKTENLEIIRERVDEVILIGTAKRPKTAPTGIFRNPMLPGTYVVTSHMGYRWGRQHEGVDLGTPVGTPVYASDGGTVTFVGVSGGYGNLIIIDHGNGMTTRYGHLSSFGVTQGQKVYQGQYIAASGNTGRSTGPHLHFEIRSNGSPINPETNVSGGL